MASSIEIVEWVFEHMNAAASLIFGVHLVMILGKGRNTETQIDQIKLRAFDASGMCANKLDSTD